MFPWFWNCTLWMWWTIFLPYGCLFAVFFLFWLWLRQKSQLFFKLDLRSNSCFAVKLKEDDEAMFEKCLKLAWAKKHTAMMSFKSGNFQGDVTKAKQFTLSDANHFECKHYLFKNAKKDNNSEFPWISAVTSKIYFMTVLSNFGIDGNHRLMRLLFRVERTKIERSDFFMKTRFSVDW